MVIYVFSKDLLEDLNTQLTEIDGVELASSAGSKGFPGSESFAFEVVKAGAVTKLAEVIGNWLLKDNGRMLTLKIGNKEMTATGLSKKDQLELIDWFQIQAGMDFTKK
jgi:hypothetical protein